MIDYSKQRVIYADILRIVAIIAIIIIHTSVPLFSEFNSNISWWWIGNIFDSATLWGVPIFVMVSGMLLLDPKKEETIKIFIIKRFNRVLIPFIFWGVVYSIWMYRVDIIEGQMVPMLTILRSFISGPVFYHLWFIYMLIGLYIITPIIRIYIKYSDLNNLNYFIFLWFIFNGFFNFIERISGIHLGIYHNFFLGYIGYFVLGYYLHIIEFNKKQVYFIYLLSIFGFIMTAMGTFILTKNNGGIYNGTFYDYLSPNIIFMSVGIFVLIKNHNWNKTFGNRNSIPKIANIGHIIEFSSLTFGIYLVHALVLDLISLTILPLKINALLIHPLFGVPCTTLLTVVISFYITKIMKKIPLLQKIC